MLPDARHDISLRHFHVYFHYASMLMMPIIFIAMLCRDYFHF